MKEKPRRGARADHQHSPLNGASILQGSADATVGLRVWSGKGTRCKGASKSSWETGISFSEIFHELLGSTNILL